MTNPSDPAIERIYDERTSRVINIVTHVDIFGRRVALLNEHGEAISFGRNIGAAERARAAMGALDRRFYPQTEEEE